MRMPLAKPSMPGLTTPGAAVASKASSVPVLARPDNGAKSSSAAQSPPGAPLPPVLDGLTTHVCVLD
jgi:hypothetical protein